MTINPIYMERCFQLAKKGAGFTNPNPHVGAVIVCNNKIIGEGYHRRYGEAHAEVNAINSVKDKSLLSQSTLYVSLEPCSHYGKTPPCSELIVRSRIPSVVIANKDPNPKVSGRGIEFLRENGVEVQVGILEKEGKEINKMFLISQTLKRPFVILKWAQSSDGFIDHKRESLSEKEPIILSNSITQTLVHRLRAKVQAIMVGTNTVILDNPQLTTRKWFGKNPIRVTIDRHHKIPSGSSFLTQKLPTIIFTTTLPAQSITSEAIKYIQIDSSEDSLEQILSYLYNQNIHSLLVEGGALLLSSFIEKNLWDEACIEVSDQKIISGVKAPSINTNSAEVTAKKYLDSVQFHIKSKITRNFL